MPTPSAAVDRPIPAAAPSLSPGPGSGRCPTLLITCGDPSGIGPEVVALAWARTAAHATARLRVVADPALLVAVLGRRRGLPRLAITTVDAADERASRPDELIVIRPQAEADRQAVVDGTISAAGGAAAAAALDTALAILRSSRADAIVTGPLHKEALHAAGCDAPGHTELLARACGLEDEAASMMLWLPAATGPGGLGVVHATLHESLRTALGRLSSAGIAAAGARLAEVLPALLGRQPRIAVAALNPHGGEGGLFGDDERLIVAPAVTTLAAAGLAVSGPLPADTLFLRASRGEFDGVVALHHDQGHIPVKLLGMHRAVNITLGLPLVRTSVAHGTAFDIVGRGEADPASMLAAIDAAVRLVAAGWPTQRAAAIAASGPAPSRNCP
ncbi:MAG: 4-hydroxythreonine-4-phosphate dehydrogenase PdxA [Planctomycetota bacterium]|jgi:4-hydroxythreonine-4-phosphate dehydrogenase|nr:MAG: 4-hydroxythreonine-4-phosphate dehydrogenase PdxA [Planctomycetota bacterium]